MLDSHGYASSEAHARLAPFAFKRRDPSPQDVVLELTHCGICHSDIHYVHNDWGFSRFPVVPGHEIVGRVTHVGSAVTKFKVGDLAAIGCLVDSCRQCPACVADEEHMCIERPTPTYSGIERGTSLPTYGGYSTNYVVDQRFALKLAATLDPAAAAPLLCAGITTYSPLRHWQVGPGQKVGIVGLGGLGTRRASSWLARWVHTWSRSRRRRPNSKTHNVSARMRWCCRRMLRKCASTRRAST